MIRYNQEQLNTMAEQIDIVDYISQTQELIRKGNNYFCCCPFHDNDDTPSLCIYPDSHSWYCFGCGAGSSIYDWIMKSENKTFQEAVETVCHEINFDSPLETIIQSESIGVLKELKKCTESHHKDVEERKILNWSSDYLDKFSDEDPQEWLDEGITHEALKTYNIRIDKNANRIVYPVLDSNDNLIGVKGRTRLSAYKELGLSKYMNYYKVGNLDYFQGWQQMVKDKKVIIFEGVKSCMKAYGWGIYNTIAAETSKLSDGQLRLLIKNGFQEVIIAFDSDQKFQDIVNNDKIKTLRRFTQVSIIYDKHKLLGEKESPVDRGEKIFRKLLEERCKL